MNSQIETKQPSQGGCQTAQLLEKIRSQQKEASLMQDMQKGKPVMAIVGNGKSAAALAILHHIAAGRTLPAVRVVHDPEQKMPMSPVAERDYEC